MDQLGLEKFLEQSKAKKRDNRNLTDNNNKNNKTDTNFISEDQQDSAKKNEEQQNNNFSFLEEKSKGNIFIVKDKLPPSYLIDVKYDGELEKAYLKFFNPLDGKIYRFYDNTDHKPYLLTSLSIADVESIIGKMSEYIGSVSIKRYSLLHEREVELTKVLASNPLAIGGRKGGSFRDLINPSYEANIRYHLNYIYDNKLIPGLLYEIKNGKLGQIEPKINSDINEKLLLIFKDHPKEVRELVNNYKSTFFSDIPQLKRCAIDIEVESTKGKIPDPNTATNKVISVGFADTDDNIWVYVLNEDNKKIDKSKVEVKIKEYSSEKQMLEDVFDIFYQYPIIVTFNGDNFDLAYLNQRAKNLGIEEERNPIIKTTSTQHDTYLEYGLHIDLYRFFRQASMRIYAFGGKYDRVTLDELGAALLNKQKIKLDKDIWDLELEDLIKYNARDAEITLELTTFNQNQVMEIIFMLSRITKMPIDDFIRSSVSVWIQNWLYFEHRQRNYLIPRREDILQSRGLSSTEAMIKGKKYQGAIVIQPKAGVWWDVYVLDFASLYPSIIKTRNLSYETINCNHRECKLNNKIPETNHWVCTKKVGIISMLIGFIRDVRVYWFKQRAKDSNIPERERSMNNVIQSSLKVLINASYGVLGSENFALYCPPVAESTTALAREAISKTKNYCENKLKRPVIYGDTDSIFIYKPTKEDIEELKEWAFNTFQIELGTDYVFRYCALSSRKKNYFGITTSGKPIVKGLMGKKKNTPALIKRAFDKVLAILSEVKTPEELEEAKNRIISIVRQTIKKLETKTYKLEDLAISVTLSKRLKEYESWTQPLQAAIQLIQNNPNLEISPGQNITFIKTKPFKIQIAHNLINDKLNINAESSVKPIELAKKEDVDITKMKELVQSTFVQLLDTIGISWNEVKGIKSLDTFFN